MFERNAEKFERFYTGGGRVLGVSFRQNQICVFYLTRLITLNLLNTLGTLLVDVVKCLVVDKLILMIRLRYCRL